jgi:uncharacterized Tic20 family protein
MTAEPVAADVIDTPAATRSWYEQRTTEAGPPTEEDMRHASYAHIFAAIGVILSAGFLLPMLGALVPLILNKNRHPFVVFHVTQSLWYQVALFGGNIVLGIVVSAISVITCGFGAVLYSLDAIPVLIAIVHPIIVGLSVMRGERVNTL